MEPWIHPTAIVERPVRIGPGTKIWHFSHIMAGADIGTGCILGQNVFVAPAAKIGDRVKIQNNVSVYDRVELEDEVFCGPSVVFTNVINPRSFISRRSEFQKTLVRKGVTLGANATILCGITIGRYAFIGAGSVVTKDVPNYALVYGNPARLKGWICQCGIKLNKHSRGWMCPSCKLSYIPGKAGLKVGRRLLGLR
jgi:UDP-2-acetamido-3-amino-2,3-dideoxy-glucuronate N-acetyltransferase